MRRHPDSFIDMTQTGLI